MDFNLYIFPGQARVTLMPLINFESKRCRTVKEKDAFLQNTLPQNVIAVKKLFFRQYNKVEEVAALLFSFVFFFYYLDFPIEALPILCLQKIGPSSMKIKTNSSYEIHLLKRYFAGKNISKKVKSLSKI